MTTTAPTAADIQTAADEVWGEICDDIAAGNLPKLIDEYADLHDYVDANEYGGFTDLAKRADWPTEAHAEVQELVDARMKADRAVRLTVGHYVAVALRDGGWATPEDLVVALKEDDAAQLYAEIVDLIGSEPPEDVEITDEVLAALRVEVVQWHRDLAVESLQQAAQLIVDADE